MWALWIHVSCTRICVLLKKDKQITTEKIKRLNYYTTGAKKALRKYKCPITSSDLQLWPKKNYPVVSQQDNLQNLVN